MPGPRELLLSAMRASLEQGQLPSSAVANSRVSSDLVALAMQTRMSFQLLQSAGHPGTDELADKEVTALVAQVRAGSVRNALQQVRLKQLVEACAREGIDLMLVKGLWLVHCVYRDAAARESGDIDLLFHPQDMQRFTQLARGLGYEVPADGASLAAGAHSTNEFALRHPHSGLLVDVHWSLTNPATETPVDETLLWERSEVVDIGGVRCRTLGLEDHLLYLCFHAAMHHGFWAVGPRCLYDVAMVVRQPPRPIRWDVLGARAQALGWQRAAWLMFSLVDAQLGVRVPAAVMQGLHRESPADARVRELALDTLFAALEQESLYRHLAWLLAPASRGQRVTALRQLLLPSRVQMTNQFGLSRAPTWLLHARRWSGKLRDWAPELAGLMAGRRWHRDELARTRQIRQWLDASA